MESRCQTENRRETENRVSTTFPAWEIHHALARLAHLADDGEVADYLDMFTEDAVWETPAVEATGTKADRRAGRADIGAGAAARRASGIQGPGSATRHVVHTIEVTAQPDGTATSVAYWAFYRSTVTAPALAGLGRYDDTWRLTDAGWKLASRRITLG
jgi:3-phenylpropionate/cinnamic acid dioxygenase small subunit